MDSPTHVPLQQPLKKQLEHKALLVIVDDYVHSSYAESLCFATLTHLCIQPPPIPAECLTSDSFQLLEKLNFTEPHCYEKEIT